MNSLASRMLGILFPPVCIHCQEKTEAPKYPLCAHCLELLELKEKGGVCGAFSMAQTCEATGPAGTLRYHLEKKNCPGLAAVMGAYMVAQLVKLNWPLPEVIIPMPLSFFQFLRCGYHPNLLLAKSVAKLCEAEVASCLHQGFNEAISWKRQENLSEKKVLLIGSHYEEKQIRRCLRKLLEGYPSDLFALTFC